MSIQAYIIGIAYALMTIMSVIASIKNKTATAFTGFFVLVSIAIIALIVYDTQCLIDGNCIAWSWVRTVIYVILPIFMIFLYVHVMLNSNKNAEEENNQNQV